MSREAQAAQNAIKANLYAPHLPWNVTKSEDLGPAVMRFMQEQEPYYRRWAQKWFENVQFIYGNQSVKWSRKYGFAIDTDFLRRLPNQQQKAQTNIARVVAEGIAAMLFGNLPVWDVEAGTESSVKGKRFKRLVQKFLDAYMERLCMQKEFQASAMILAAYGQVGSWVDWKSNIGKIIEIPKLQKVRAPVFTDYMAPNPFTGGLLEVPIQALDSSGRPLFEEIWEPVLDQMGRQIIDKIFAGDAAVDILTPFEYRREIGSGGMHKTKFVERVKLLDYDEYLDEYGELEGRTKEFFSVKPVTQSDAVFDLALRHFMLLKFTTPPILDDYLNRRYNLIGSNIFRQKVVVIEHFDRPHWKKWPNGRRLIITNGVCTHVTRPSYTTNKLDGWHPAAEAQWMTVAPNSVASGPVNDSIVKNRELNVKDGLTATAVRRNMGGHLLIKTGAGLVPEHFTGEPGAVLECSDPFGARYLHDEMPIPPVLAALRQADKDDIYETSGVMDGLRGAPSQGASSGYQEKQREEREEKRLTPYRTDFEGFVGTIGEKLFICVKSNVRSLDDYVMGYMIRAGAGEFKPQDVVAILTQPIEFGIDIKVKKSSMAVKSRASFQALLQEIAQGPAGQRIAQDARVMDAYLKEFDIETLRDGSAPQRERAERENDAFADMLRLGPNAEGIREPMVIFEDDDDIHLAYHDEWGVQNAEELLSNEWLMRKYLLHKEMHRIQRQEKAGQLLPGTTQQVPSMYQVSQRMPQPTVPTIAQHTQAMSAQRAQMQQQPQPGPQGQRPPQAPTQSAGPGQGGRRVTDPNAPSGNTPRATVQGGVG